MGGHRAPIKPLQNLSLALKVIRKWLMDDKSLCLARARFQRPNRIIQVPQPTAKAKSGSERPSATPSPCRGNLPRPRRGIGETRLSAARGRFGTDFLKKQIVCPPPPNPAVSNRYTMGLLARCMACHVVGAGPAFCGTRAPKSRGCPVYATTTNSGARRPGAGAVDHGRERSGNLRVFPKIGGPVSRGVGPIGPVSAEGPLLTDGAW